MVLFFVVGLGVGLGVIFVLALTRAVSGLTAARTLSVCGALAVFVALAVGAAMAVSTAFTGALAADRLAGFEDFEVAMMGSFCVGRAGADSAGRVQIQRLNHTFQKGSGKSGQLGFGVRSSTHAHCKHKVHV